MDVIHIFDLDHTLINVNSSLHYSQYLFKERKLQWSDITWVYLLAFSYQLGFISLEELHQISFDKLFKGKKQSFWITCLEEYLQKNLHHILNPAVYFTLQDVQKRGGITAIFSSGPDFIVRPIAKALNINYLECSKYEVDKDGHFVKISSLLTGKDKEAALRRLARKKGVSLSHVTAYSDSILDLPFLESAGKAVCVNPDKKLKSEALIKGWEIIIDGKEV